jgi:Uma2 family endonuclease
VVAPIRQRFSYTEYLLLEEHSSAKHEFLGGHVWAMAGGSPDHGAIAANIIVQLGTQLGDRSCRVFTSDVRIRVLATGLATYPDVSVVCDEQQTDPADPKGTTIVNPTFIVEVLSPSTEEYDRGEKLAHYKQVPSLREILLVAHEEQRLELWRRDGDHWVLEVVRETGSVTISAIGCTLAVVDVYRNPLAG